MPESKLWLLRDTRQAKRQGREAILKRQRARLAETVAYARAHSPYYASLYRDLPEHIEDPRLLPVTSKQLLMPRFDDWLTERGLSLAQVMAFIEQPEQMGQPLAGKYYALTTSGTSGTRGVFLKDPREMAVTSALSARMLGDWLTPGEMARILLRGLRMAMIFAVDRPVASFTAAVQLRAKITRILPQGLGIFSVHDPMPKLVSALNAFQPAMISAYASTMALLAQAQQAGQLRLAPDAEPEAVWESALAQVRNLLAEQGLEHVTLERASEPPRQAEGGKYREIIPFKPAEQAP